MRRVLLLLVALSLASCKHMRERDVVTIYLAGAGPISMVAIKHGEEGRQLFIVRTEDEQTNQRHRGEFFDIDASTENRVVKILGQIEKGKAPPLLLTNGPPLVMEVHLGGDEPRAFRVDTLWGADPRVKALIATINTNVPRSFRLASTNPAPAAVPK